MKLGKAWTHARPHVDPALAAAELRIRTAAAIDCLARAKADPASVQGMLNRQMALNHARAVVRMLPDEAVAQLFAKDEPK